MVEIFWKKTDPLTWSPQNRENRPTKLQTSEDNLLDLTQHALPNQVVERCLPGLRNAFLYPKKKKKSFGEKLKYHPPHAVNLVSIKAGDSPHRPISRIQIFPGDFISIYIWKGEGEWEEVQSQQKTQTRVLQKIVFLRYTFFYIPKII